MAMALVVIDMQEHFRAVADPLVPRVAALAAAARAAGCRVVWTQHGHPDPVADEARSPLVRWWGPEASIRLGSAAWRLLPGLGVDAARDAVVDEKRTYDAFHGTRLDTLLRDAGVTAVCVAGVLTELCCETTARSAMVRGYDVFFLEDGTASDDARRHGAAVEVIAHGVGRVVTCDEAAAAFGRGGGRGRRSSWRGRSSG